MAIRDLFKKDIGRHIDGVIKAEDGSVLKNELEEFVITDEIRTNLETFFENYIEGNSNGAWISGFFGSGKSHLLKILAAVLGNKDVGGVKAANIFLKHCEGNDSCTILKGLVERAVRIPSSSVLFNIGQQADATGNANRKDTILPAFLQVFNAHCGYCEQNLAVAAFERQLDEEVGHLAQFEEEFQRLSGQDWKTRGRTRVTRFGREIDQAYTAVTGTTAQDIIARYASQTFSVKDFAQLVKTYIDKQAPGFRLNFFVDEIGQYVANSTPLMLILQSIAEMLNTTCRNASWLIVTSQANVSDVVGELNDAQGNDFSRIIGRFHTKIQLSSKNVDEVIRGRLLEKEPEQVPAIASVYDRYSGDMQSIYDFADGMRRYRCFSNCDDFVNLYPFVPYQFDLFRSAMIELSNHDAFTGRFQAVGERSTLEVCQIALKELDETGQVGNMIPFDLWFDGIEASIKPNIKNQVHVASNQLHTLSEDMKKLAIRVLKVLLIVKYVRGDFVASPRNICSLLINDMSVNFAQLLADVKQVLGILESQSYVQRIGENYEYLTDSEKDLDSEIKRIIVDQSEVTRMLKDIVFADIIRERRITTSNGQAYPFTQMLDNAVVGRPDGDLSVHFITPANPDLANTTTIAQNAYGKDELTVILKPDTAVLTDIQNYLKTTKYLAQNPPMSQTDPALRNLLESRQTHTSAIYQRVEVAIKGMTASAKMLVRGQEISPRSSDPSGRVAEGFSKLADTVYIHYRMVEKMSKCQEEAVPRFLRADPQIPGISDESEAERELLSTIKMNSSQGITTTMKGLLGTFEKKPYGWPLGVVECLIAKLIGKGKLEASQGGEPIPPERQAAAIRSTRAHETLVLQPQMEVDPQQIRALKDFARDFFSSPIAATEAKQVATDVRDKLAGELSSWNEIAARAGEFPFVSGLRPIMEKVRSLTARPVMNLYAPDAVGEYGDLVEMKEGIVDRIVAMVNGPQGTTFKDARAFVQREEANFRKMQEWGGEWDNAFGKFQRLAELVESPDVYKNAGMVQITGILRDLKTDLATAISQARSKATALVQEKAETIKAMPEYAKASDSVRADVDASIDGVKQSIAGEQLIASIQGTAHVFADRTYIDLMNKVVASAQPPPKPAPDSGSPNPPATPATPLVVSYASVANGYTKKMIASQEEVEDYLAFLGARLETAIKEGKRIAFN